MIDIEIFIGIAFISGVLVFLLYRLFQAVSMVEELEKENKEVQQKLNNANQRNLEVLTGIEDMKKDFVRQKFFYENIALHFYEIACQYGVINFFPRLQEYHILDVPKVDVINSTYLDGTNNYGRFITHQYKELFSVIIEGCIFPDDEFSNFRAALTTYIDRIGFNVEAFNLEDFGATVFIVISQNVSDR